jgi:hypothetical protein
MNSTPVEGCVSLPSASSMRGSVALPLNVERMTVNMAVSANGAAIRRTIGTTGTNVTQSAWRRCRRNKKT